MFCERFNYLLKSRKINAITLSKTIGVPKSVVYEWKQGQRLPSIENLFRLSDYFGVTIEYLTGRADTETDAEKELLALLQAAREISVGDHDALIDTFKSNLNIYLKNAEKNKHE